MFRLNAAPHPAFVRATSGVHVPSHDDDDHDSTRALARRSDAGKGASEREVPGLIARAIGDVLARVPSTDEGPSPDPQTRARRIASDAAARAALVSGGLALPPGPLGLLTIVPDLMAIWRIQAQMVVDIAAAYGVESPPTREQMIYCLFRHAAVQAVRDLAARVGGRLVVRVGTSRVVEVTLRKVGVRLSQRLVARTAARWLPIIGAVGVGAYAYWDTAQVARTAISVFGRHASPRSSGGDSSDARLDF